MGPTVFHKIFLNISHIQTECGKYSGIFYEILPIPQNIVMNLNDVMNLIHKFIYIEKETLTLHPHVRTKFITCVKSLENNSILLNFMTLCLMPTSPSWDMLCGWDLTTWIFF